MAGKGSAIRYHQARKKIKELEEKLSVAYKDIENLVKEKDMLYAQQRKYKEAFFIQDYQVGSRKLLERLQGDNYKVVDEAIGNLVEGTKKLILDNFKKHHLEEYEKLKLDKIFKGYMPERDLARFDELSKTIKGSLTGEEVYYLMTKAYEQHAKNPLGPEEYFEYDTGVRVGKAEDNTKEVGQDEQRNDFSTNAKKR